MIIFAGKTRLESSYEAPPTFRQFYSSLCTSALVYSQIKFDICLTFNSLRFRSRASASTNASFQLACKLTCGPICCICASGFTVSGARFPTADPGSFPVKNRRIREYVSICKLSDLLSLSEFLSHSFRF